MTLRSPFVRSLAAVAALALLASSPAPANDLMEVYRLALDRDLTLRVMAEQRAARIESRPQAIAALLPSVAATGSVSRDRFGYEQPPPDGNLPPDATSRASLQTFTGDVRGYGLNLSQTVWSLEAFRRLRSANRQVAEAEARYRGEHLRLMLRVSQAYFAVLSARDQLETRQAERDAFGVLLDQASNREQTGVGPRSDVVQARAYHAASERGVIDARMALDDAQRRLETITGETRTRFAGLQEDARLEAPVPLAADDWVARANEGNLDLQAAWLAAEAADHAAAAQTARHLPVVQLQASTSRLSQAESLGGRQNLDSVGLALRWPLFQGGEIASQARAARATHRATVASAELTGRDTERQVRAAHRAAVVGVDRIAASERAVQDGRDAVEQARRNIEFGTGTEFELLTAQVNYFTSLRAWHQARFDQLDGVLTLKQLAGTLDERDLAAIDSLLIDTPGAP